MYNITQFKTRKLKKLNKKDVVRDQLAKQAKPLANRVKSDFSTDITYLDDT